MSITLLKRSVSILQHYVWMSTIIVNDAALDPSRSTACEDYSDRNVGNDRVFSILIGRASGLRKRCLGQREIQFCVFED